MELNCEDWMSSLPEELWDVPLTHLAIPGSHDAMSYCLDINSPLVESESDSFRLLDSLCCCFTRPTIFKWATTQDRSIEEQLSRGVRYFDLRIAHKPKDSSSDLYFTHVIYTHVTVVDTLQSVATWLESHPKEVVILACSHFEGMTERLHQSFIFSLTRMFGSKLCPKREPNLTLRHFWASGYQLVLSYESQEAAVCQELWPEIPYWWANRRTADELISYMERKRDSGRPEGFYVCGLNLTADRCYIAKNSKQSLRTLTLANWKGLRRWLEEQKPAGDHQSLNIVAGDFVGPLPLCSLVIALNLKRLQKSSVR